MATDAMKYVVMVWCTGIGWAESKYGGDTMQEALVSRDELLADDSKWVNPDAKRKVKIVLKGSKEYDNL